jgi:hypothetical protein
MVASVVLELLDENGRPVDDESAEEEGSADRSGGGRAIPLPFLELI